MCTEANILLTAPYPTPSDELFKRASSFQEFLEAELKTHYKTEDAGRHPEYLKELLALSAVVVLRGSAGRGRIKQSDDTESPGTI